MEEMPQGQSLSGWEDGAKEAVGEKRAKRLRPSQCRSHMRRTLAREFEEIVDGFVAAAKKGSCPHVKLVTELLQEPPKSTSSRKGSVARLLEQMDSEGAKKERLGKEQIGKK